MMSERWRHERDELSLPSRSASAPTVHHNCHARGWAGRHGFGAGQRQRQAKTARASRQCILPSPGQTRKLDAEARASARRRAERKAVAQRVTGCVRRAPTAPSLQLRHRMGVRLRASHHARRFARGTRVCPSRRSQQVSSTVSPTLCAALLCTSLGHNRAERMEAPRMSGMLRGFRKGCGKCCAQRRGGKT